MWSRAQNDMNARLMKEFAILDAICTRIELVQGTMTVDPKEGINIIVNAQAYIGGAADNEKRTPKTEKVQYEFEAFCGGGKLLRNQFKDGIPLKYSQ